MTFVDIARIDRRTDTDVPRATIVVIGVFVMLLGTATALLGYVDLAKPMLARDMGIDSIPLPLDYLLIAMGGLGLYWGGRLLMRGLLAFRS